MRCSHLISRFSPHALLRSIMTATICFLVFILGTRGTVFAQPRVPKDFADRHKPPIVIAVDGFSLAASGGGEQRQAAYLGPDLQRSANFQNMKAEIKTFAWSGDIRQTVGAVEDLKKSITDAANLARTDQRTLAVIAHSWGGVLAYLSVRDLERNQTLRPGDIAILITIHTPLANRGSPSSNLATVYGQPAWAIGDTVKQYLKEEPQRPQSVSAWSNYWSSTETYRIASSIPVANVNIDTNEQHQGSHTNLTWLDTYGAEVAAAVAKRDNQPQAKTQAPVDLTFQMKDGNTVAGRLQARAVTVKTPFGTMNIPVVEIVGFRDGEFRLRDGTVVKGEILDTKLNISTRYGVLALVPGDIVSFGVGLPAKPGEPLAQGPPSAPTSPGSVAGTPKPSRPSEPGPLPQSYGVFVVADGRLYELRPEGAETAVYRGLTLMMPTRIREIPTCCSRPEQITRIPMSSEIELILHRRGLTSPEISLSPFHFVRKLLWITPRLRPLESDEQIKEVDAWLQWANPEDVVQAPVSGQSDMIRIQPREKLEPGIYSVQVSTGGHLDRYPPQGVLVFAIDVDPTKHSNCWDWKVDDYKASGEMTAYPCSRNALPGGASSGTGPHKREASTGRTELPKWEGTTIEEWLGGTLFEYGYQGEMHDKLTGKRTAARLRVRTIGGESFEGTTAWKHIIKIGNFMTTDVIQFIGPDGSVLQGLFDGDRQPVGRRLLLVPMRPGAIWEGGGIKCTVEDGGSVVTPTGTFQTLKRKCSGHSETIDDWLSPGVGIVKRIWTFKTLIYTFQLTHQRTIR